ncbi:hypothetical protein H0H92_008313 [Tricholoma furcatifolium]|nr:hypothetical protein H0H92_008313 [Tricholoma furcatifolium]
MEVNRGSIAPVPVSQTNLAIESGPLPKIDQSMQPDANQAQSKLKAMRVALDGLLTGITVAKEASDWNPFLKAALGGVVAVVELAKTVHGNWQDMQDTVNRIEGLLPILETSERRLKGRKDGFNKEDKLMNFAKSIQAELDEIKKMQSHSVFRRVLQGTKDADTLLGIYKSIAEALEQFKLLSVIQVQSER